VATAFIARRPRQPARSSSRASTVTCCSSHAQRRWSRPSQQPGPNTPRIGRSVAAMRETGQRDLSLIGVVGVSRWAAESKLCSPEEPPLADQRSSAVIYGICSPIRSPTAWGTNTPAAKTTRLAGISSSRRRSGATSDRPTPHVADQPRQKVAYLQAFLIGETGSINVRLPGVAGHIGRAAPELLPSGSGGIVLGHPSWDAGLARRVPSRRSQCAARRRDTATRLGAERT
jgi:hypothetical protein